MAAGLSGLALAGTAAVALPATAGAEVLPENCAEIAADPARTHVECAFGHTGGAQTFTVPAGVTELEVTAVGGRGGASENAKGGAGAVVAGTLTVAPGTALTVNVGGDGTPSTAGFNGGGDGGAYSRTFPCDERDPIWDPFCRDVDETGPDDAPDVRGAGGGGATDVRDGSGLDSRIIVAGGGGGAGHWRIGGDAGAGGDYGARGKGGTSTSGGAGGGDRVVGTAGTLGDGGAGGLMGYGCQVWPGGGGGGLFGGGGGGQAADDPSYCGGGGGGSSLAPAGGTETVAADGQAASVLIRFTLDEPLAPAPCEGSLCVFTGSLAGLIGER